jgi:phage terminase large subunit
MPAWTALEAGCKRACWIAHRRWGKDDLALNWAATSAVQRQGNYWHCLPEYAQGRKAIWQAVNPHSGKRRIDEAFPLAIRKRTVDQEMFIEFINGSTWQVIGSDTYDKLVGSTPAGITFSEYALANPAAWDYFRPMLAENGGWAIFISTVRGRNHFWKLAEYAKTSPEWHYLNQDARHTGVFTEEQLDRERRELCATHGDDEGEARFRQEYLNDPSAAIPGSYYGKLISKAEDEGRITRVPWVPSVPVSTGWDIGYGDSTAIWFAQHVSREIRILDYYEASGCGLDHYAKILKEKPYTYDKHILPHDAAHGSIQTGQTTVQILASLGIRASVLPMTSVQDRINASRNFIPTCVFDEEKTGRGLNSLRAYQRVYDEKLHDFKQNPLHDWSSHGADAFGYLAQGFRPHKERPINAHARSEYAIFG